jgi:hypothetical protein
VAPTALPYSTRCTGAVAPLTPSSKRSTCWKRGRSSAAAIREAKGEAGEAFGTYQCRDCPLARSKCRRRPEWLPEAAGVTDQNVR